VDLCTPTDLHADMAIAALKAGKHVICEKPMALNFADCDRMIAAAEAAGRFLFVGQCIRFWPAYEALADMVHAGKLGAVRMAKFTRLSGTPMWSESNWILDPSRSGGALLDLHIHDADFVSHLWGLPPAVFAQAASIITPGHRVDHIVTDYLFKDFVCVAEGGWAFHSGFPFTMAYRVIGEAGTLAWQFSDGPEPTLYRNGQEPVKVPVAEGTGYQREMRYFLDCMEAGRAPTTVTPQGAREAVRLVLAEAQSVAAGTPVAL
jgi:predicted dehydrogenase